MPPALIWIRLDAAPVRSRLTRASWQVTGTRNQARAARRRVAAEGDVLAVEDACPDPVLAGLADVIWRAGRLPRARAVDWAMSALARNPGAAVAAAGLPGGCCVVVTRSRPPAVLPSPDRGGGCSPALVCGLVAHAWLVAGGQTHRGGRRLRRRRASAASGARSPS